MQGKRTERLGEVLRAEITDLIRRRAKDPRLTELITVTGVEVSPDLKQAKVFFSLLGSKEEDKEQRAGVADALEHSKGFFKRELGKRLRLKFPPDLSFHYDASGDYGDRIERLLREIHEQD